MAAGRVILAVGIWPTAPARTEVTVEAAAFGDF
jgi:hypothetical protein